MALINCKECGQSVSDKAPTCVKCGVPIAALKEVSSAGVVLNTTQETSKKLKIQALISGLMIVIGLVWFFRAESDGQSLPALITVIGIVWNIVNKVRIWWHHK